MTKDEALSAKHEGATTVALKLALEALTHLQPNALTSFYTIGDRNKAIKAIRECLAQPEQEPVAWANLNALSEQINLVNCGTVYRLPSEAEKRQPLYTTPPQRKPLTSKQIREWWASENGFEDCDMTKLDDFTQVVRGVEGKHGIKE